MCGWVDSDATKLIPPLFPSLIRSFLQSVLVAVYVGICKIYIGRVVVVVVYVSMVAITVG